MCKTWVTWSNPLCTQHRRRCPSSCTGNADLICHSELADTTFLAPCHGSLMRCSTSSLHHSPWCIRIREEGSNKKPRRRKQAKPASEDEESSEDSETEDEESDGDLGIKGQPFPPGSAAPGSPPAASPGKDHHPSEVLISHALNHVGLRCCCPISYRVVWLYCASICRLLDCLLCLM